MPGKGSLPNYVEDVLVAEIKENLSLESRSSSGRPMKSRDRRSLRPSPYAVPPASRSEPLSAKWGVRRRRRYPSTSASEFLCEEPLRMLQELISDGSLIKEAVRRLQLGLSPKLGGGYTDSEDDCRSPSKAPGKYFCQMASNG